MSVTEDISVAPKKLEGLGRGRGYIGIETDNRMHEPRCDKSVLGLACVCCTICAMIAVVVVAVIFTGAAARPCINKPEPDRRWMDEHALRLDAMSDPTANPCQDFYQYSCGGFLAETAVPADKTSVSSFDTLAATIDSELLAVLGEDWPFVGTWFNACKDTDERAAAGLSALAGLQQEVDALNDTRVGLPALLALLHAHQVPAMFSVWFAADERNVSVVSAYTGYPAMMATAQVWNSTASASQRAAVLSLMTALLGDTSAARATAFERDWLAAGMLSKAQRYVTPTQWISAQPECAVFSWPAYWSALVGSPAPTEMGVVDLAQAQRLCDALARVSMDTIRDYLRASIALAYVDSYPNASALLAPLREATTGVHSQQTLDAECMLSASAAFPTLLGHYFSREFFADATIARARQILQGVRAAMAETLALVPWLDGPTRVAALQKLSSLRSFIGHPATWPASLPGPYVSAYAHLANVVSHQHASMSYNIALWTSPELFRAVAGAPPAWDMPVFDVNAYYSPQDNVIVFPEGILGGVFFNASAPDAANYGSIGAVMGHEISHGFDNQGRQYDAQGNRRDWWTPQSSEQFDQRAQCIVDLYSSFETPYGRVDGHLTEGENIADSGGLALALRAYRNQMNSRPADERAQERADIRLAYKFNDEQLFFRSYASTWCGKRTPQRAAQLLQSDPHSPYKARVNNVVSQSVDFLRAFGCPLPSGNINLCKVW